MESIFKKTSFNCQQATFQALRKEEEKLSVADKMKLFVHLLYCGPCRLFLKQTKMIEAAARKYKDVIFNEPTHKLSPELKNNLQKKMDELSSEL